MHKEKLTWVIWKIAGKLPVLTWTNFELTLHPTPFLMGAFFFEFFCVNSS